MERTRHTVCEPKVALPIAPTSFGLEGLRAFQPHHSKLKDGSSSSTGRSRCDWGLQMPTPEGWEWLNDLPEEWRTPLDLLEPTADPDTNLVIRILSCEILGHEVRAAVGRFVTEQALFTIWFLDDVKGSGRGMKESTLLSQIPIEQTRTVYEAWKKFEGIGDLDAPNGELRERRMVTAAELATALEHAAETLTRVREGNVGIS